MESCLLYLPLLHPVPLLLLFNDSSAAIFAALAFSSTPSSAKPAMIAVTMLASTLLRALRGPPPSRLTPAATSTPSAVRSSLSISPPDSSHGLSAYADAFSFIYSTSGPSLRTTTCTASFLAYAPLQLPASSSPSDARVTALLMATP